MQAVSISTFIWANEAMAQATVDLSPVFLM